MKIKSIIIESFRGFNKKQEFNINGSQLILLYGPNGHGKTSFFDCIEWTLTGKINRYDISSDERNRSKFIGNSFSDTPPYVQIILEDDDKELIITRTGIKDESKTDYGKSDLRLEIGGQICHMKGAAQSYLENEIIESDWLNKIDYENFNNTFNLTHYSSQEKMNHFLKGAKEGERYDALSTILGTEQYNTYKLKFKEAQNLFKDEIRKIDDLTIKANTKKHSFEHELKKIEENTQSYDSIKTQSLLEKYNQLFNRKLNIHDNVSILLQNIHTDNSVIFKENNELFSHLDIIKSLIKDFAEYQNVYNNLSLDKEKLLNLTRFSELTAKLSDIKWLKENYKDYIESNKTLELKHEQKSITQTDIQQFEDYVRNYEKIISLISATLTDCINTNNYTKLQNLVIKEINDEKLLMIFLNIINEIEATIIDLKKAKNKEIELKNEIIKNNEWLKNLERINSQYSTLLRNAIDYVRTVDDLDNCPICGNNKVNSQSIIDYTQKAQMEVNIEIPRAQSMLNKVKGEQVQCQIELKKLELNYKEMLDSLKNEISKVVETINDRKIKINVLYEDLNNFQETILIIGKNQEKFKQTLVKYDILTFDIRQIDTLMIEVEGQKNEMIQENNYLEDIVVNDEEFKSVNQKIEKNNLFIKNYKILLDKAYYISPDYKIDTIKEFIEKQESFYTEKKTLLEEKGSVLKSLISETENLKTHQLLSTKRKELSIEINTLETLESNKQEIEKKILVLDEAIKSIPIAIEKINENSIKELFDLVQKIYSKLNSHPVFSAVDFKTEKRYGAFRLLLNVLSDKKVEANPAFIYSAAQINTVALSIFLAMSITQKWSKLDFIAMDDPIQSMDSLNSLSFIDFLRQLSDQEGYNKQLIISTHDSTFFELMQKKFQLSDVAIIEFSGYSEAGPIFGDYRNRINGSPIKIKRGKSLDNFKELIGNI